MVKKTPPWQNDQRHAVKQTLCSKHVSQFGRQYHGVHGCTLRRHKAPRTVEDVESVPMSNEGVSGEDLCWSRWISPWSSTMVHAGTSPSAARRGTSILSLQHNDERTKWIYKHTKFSSGQVTGHRSTHDAASSGHSNRIPIQGPVPWILL